jgi:TetR/AcrR family transcriptional regulator
MPDERHARRERRKQDRPGELLEAALDLFVEKGYAATRVEEVAARAGVSKGTLFLYFPSKEELFKAVVRENIAGRFAEWNEAFDSFQGSTADMLANCLRSWWERIGATRASGITKLMIAEARNFPEVANFYQDEVVIPGQTLIRRILQRGVARGEFQALDLDMAVYSLIAPMMFLMMSQHSPGACSPCSQGIDPVRYIEVQTRILLDGFRIRPPTAKETP